MNEVRLGIIGLGNIGSHHLSYMRTVPRVRVTAVSDLEGAKRDKWSKDYQVPSFDEGHKLIDSGLVDAVLIGTPHYYHPVLALAAMKKGLHVLTEKPVSVTAKAAAEVNAFHKRHPRLVYGAMFQMRMKPRYRKVKEIVASGELGPIQRVSWIITNWFRTQTYYDSGGWRATWGGEGGGVLVNQCPHNLDLFQWICGMPNKCQAFIGLGKHHKIEVEDDVTAYFEYPNGATGTFITTTADCPGTNRLEISGDRGKLVIEGGRPIEITKTDSSVKEFLNTSKASFAEPGRHKITIDIDNNNEGHKGITTNFIAAILDKTPLLAPAEEGINGVELANAMIMSGIIGKPVPVPTPHDAYEKLIQKLAKTSKFQKGAVKKVEANMAASFK